jgi:transcription initiation factor IIF auxiliary subunit
MSLHIEQGFKYQGSDYWKWWLWIGGPDSELDAIEQVIYKLHSTFPDPVRKVKDRASRFRLETSGWGVFTIRVRVIGKDGSPLATLQHRLVLEYPDGTSTTA